MKRLFSLAAMVLLCASHLQAADFDTWFTGQTLRVDIFHSGNKDSEFFAPDQFYQAGPWAGPRTNLITDLNLGEYQVRVYDAASSRLLYSRGYSTIFNEWQTTAEAAELYRTFHETLLVPMPRRKIQLTISRRDKNMLFRELWSIVIDPEQPATINRTPHRPPFKTDVLFEHGDPARKVDLVILGDGYSKTDLEKFRRDARHFNEAMFNTSPFRERKKDFNVRTVEVISPDSGIPKPDKNIWKRTALGMQYNTFGSARYILGTDNKALRDAAGLVPYDYIIVLINDDRYGGGGIYNLYATTYTKTDAKGLEWQMDYVYVHEFGHSFAGLGDEYYSSQVSYESFYQKTVEPWEPNITALVNPKRLKWQRFITPGTPIPTPWEKAEYDSLARVRGKLDRLAADYYEKREPIIRRQREILKNSRYAGKVGAFEGAGYESRGLYRPSVDCRMFSLSLVEFDPVCKAALERVIDHFTR